MCAVVLYSVHAESVEGFALGFGEEFTCDAYVHNSPSQMRMKCRRTVPRLMDCVCNVPHMLGAMSCACGAPVDKTGEAVPLRASNDNIEHPRCLEP